MFKRRLSLYHLALVIAVITLLQFIAANASAWRGRNPRARFQLHVAADTGGYEDRQEASKPASLKDNGPGGVGGFGGAAVGYAPVSGANGLLLGGEGAVLLGHRFSIGGAGFGLVNDVPAGGPGGGSSRIGLGYGGVVLRYHLVHRYPVYPTLGALLGFGGLSFDGNGGDAIMVIEPSAGIYMNITRWVRVGLSLSYKYTTGVDTPGLSDRDFRGPAFTGHIDFGAL